MRRRRGPYPKDSIQYCWEARPSPAQPLADRIVRSRRTVPAWIESKSNRGAVAPAWIAAVTTVGLLPTNGHRGTGAVPRTVRTRAVEHDRKPYRGRLAGPAAAERRHLQSYHIGRPKLLDPSTTFP